MSQYIIRRMLFSLVSLIGVSLVIFTLVRLLPGDAAVTLMGEYLTTPEELYKVREKLGLTRPWHQQYIIWMGGVLRGDLGRSFQTDKPVAGELAKRIPVTFEIALLAVIISLIIAIPVGVISATRQDTRIDYISRLFSIAGLSVPGFWVGTLLIVFPAIWFAWIPPLGYIPFFKNPLGNLQQFIFPALAMGWYLSASVMRMTRTTLLEVLRQDYIRTAWAKGLREGAVMTRHALKNAMIPVITMSSVQLGYLMGGTVIIEQIFSLPGIGRLLLEAIGMRDYPQMQANVLFLAVVFVVLNLLVDILYSWLDPRIRYR